MVEVVNTCLADAFNGRLLKDFFKRKEYLVLFVCLVAFILGIPNLMQVRSNVNLSDLVDRGQHNFVRQCLFISTNLV